MQLYQYQADAVRAVGSGKHVVVAAVGTGKTICSLSCAKNSGKPKVLVVSTPSVRDQRNFEQEAEQWYPVWYNSLSSFSVISWAKFSSWVQANWDSLDDWYFIYDEIDCVKAGISSNRGKAFLQIAKRTDAWSGWTATPGDCWMDFYAYFTACGLVRNKTEFQREYCITQQFRGFREVVGYQHQDKLKSMWEQISHQVDAREVLEQLPPETHKTIKLKQPKGYKQVVKTRTTLDGEFLDNSSAYCHYLRQLCCSKEKLEWVSDFVAGLNTNCIFMYNYIEEGEKLEQTINKALGVKTKAGYIGERISRKQPKVWRIDGSRHDIPTPDTIGPKDVVLIQWASGSRGLNLQFINYWVSVSPNYSWSVSTQARGRIKRIGQEATHMYFQYLICEDSIEEAVYACLKTKSDFDQEVWSKESYDRGTE